ncbi:MAG: transglycosylase SLT domain-containing protein [Leptospirillia bacterium]
MSFSKLARNIFFLCFLIGFPGVRPSVSLASSQGSLDRYMTLLDFLSSEPPFPSLSSHFKKSRIGHLGLAKIDPKALPQPLRRRALFLKAWMLSPDVPLTEKGLMPAMRAFPDLSPLLLWHLAHSRDVSSSARKTLLRLEASRENTVFAPLRRGEVGGDRARRLLRMALSEHGDRRREILGRLIATHPLSPESALALLKMRPDVPGGSLLVPRWVILQSMGANDLVLRETKIYRQTAPPFPYRDRAIYLEARARALTGDSRKARALLDKALATAPRLSLRSDLEVLRCRLEMSRASEKGLSCLESLQGKYPKAVFIPSMVVSALRQDIVFPSRNIPAVLRLPRTSWDSREGQEAAWLYGLDLALRGHKNKALAQWSTLSSYLREHAPERIGLLARARYFRGRLEDSLGHPARARDLYRKTINEGDGSAYPLWAAIACRGECGAFHLPAHHPTRPHHSPLRVRRAMEDLFQMGLFGPAVVLERLSRNTSLDRDQILRYGDLDMAISRRRQLLLADRIFPAGGTGMRLPTGEWMTAAILSGFNRSGVPTLWALSIARQESRFRERSLSVDGALGVMQLMPQTALAVVRGPEGESFPVRVEKNLGEVRHPGVNSLIGGLYLKRLLMSVPHHPERAIAGYNAGLHAVLSWRQLSKADWDFFTEAIPYQETRRYVREVLWNYAYLQRHLKGVRKGIP